MQTHSAATVFFIIISPRFELNLQWPALCDWTCDHVKDQGTQGNRIATPRNIYRLHA